MDAQDVQGILPLIQKNFFPFQTVARRFHLIDSPTKAVYIPLQGGAQLVEQLRTGQYSRDLFRRLGQYSVAVYETHFAALEQAGDLESLGDGTGILWNTALYTQETGLSLDADPGKGLFV